MHDHLNLPNEQHHMQHGLAARHLPNRHAPVICTPPAPHPLEGHDGFGHQKDRTECYSFLKLTAERSS